MRSHLLPHAQQLTSEIFQPVCFISYSLRILENRNDFLPVSRVKGFTQMCVISCNLRCHPNTTDYPSAYGK